jgi:hypothetical protein
MRKRKEILVSALQMRFAVSGNLESQLLLTNLMGNPRTLSGQATLDIWLSSVVEKGACDKTRNKREEVLIPSTLDVEARERDYKYDYSIGDDYVEEDQEDVWDGSLDNQERILEDHVSKYGWHF